MSVERAVVLAAGLGTRLKWLTRDNPKALMPVGGAAAIEHVIRRLAAQGVHDIAVNVHHHAGSLMQALGNGTRYGVRLYYSAEPQLLDSGGGVRTALDLLPGDGPLAVHNADVLCRIDVQRLARRCPAAGCALALVPNPAHHAAGDFALQGGMVREDGTPCFTFAGVSVWDGAVLQDYPSHEAFPLTRPMRALIGESRCTGLLYDGPWFDIGRPADLMRARRNWRALI